jgi:hypothetical protein
MGNILLNCHGTDIMEDEFGGFQLAVGGVLSGDSYYKSYREDVLLEDVDYEDYLL